MWPITVDGVSAGKLPSEKLIQWWPPLGVVTMLVLGFSVGKGTTPLDTWFFEATQVVFGVQPRWLLFFTDWEFLVPVLVVCVGFELYRRRWRVAAVVLACPFVANWTTQATKMLVGREKGGGYLAYPSGHTTLVVAVMGMLVLVAGGALWAYIVAVIVSTFGLLGQVACGYHYFTDTVGAVLVTTAVVTLAIWAAGQSSSSAASTSSDKSTLV